MEVVVYFNTFQLAIGSFKSVPVFDGHKGWSDINTKYFIPPIEGCTGKILIQYLLGESIVSILIPNRTILEHFGCISLRRVWSTLGLYFGETQSRA